MSRIAKFRAWHKSYKKYFNIVSINFDTNCYVLESKVHSSARQFVVSSSNIILEQFIGQLDKNGNEICERDIIRYYLDSDSVYGYEAVVPILKMETIHVVPFRCVYYKNGDKAQWDKEKYPMIAKWDEIYGIEVIGNIHQNPELLK